MCEEVPQPRHRYMLPNKPQSAFQTFSAPNLTYLNIQIIVCHNLPQPWYCYLTLIKTPAKSSETDIVSLPLVTHLNFSPEEIYESKKLKMKKLCP